MIRPTQSCLVPTSAGPPIRCGFYVRIPAIATTTAYKSRNLNPPPPSPPLPLPPLLHHALGQTLGALFNRLDAIATRKRSMTRPFNKLKLNLYHQLKTMMYSSHACFCTASSPPDCVPSEGAPHLATQEPPGWCHRGEAPQVPSCRAHRHRHPRVHCHPARQQHVRVLVCSR